MKIFLGKKAYFVSQTPRLHFEALVRIECSGYRASDREALVFTIRRIAMHLSEIAEACRARRDEAPPSLPSLVPPRPAAILAPPSAPLRPRGRRRRPQGFERYEALHESLLTAREEPDVTAPTDEGTVRVL